MKVKLKNIANLSLGVFLKPSPKGTINYLQGKDFEDDGLPSKDYKPTFIE